MLISSLFISTVKHAEEDTIMQYEGAQLAHYVDRPSRFTCRVERNGETIETHLKNTGRGADLLIPGATVSIVPAKNPERKTHWDMVSVIKRTDHGDFWVNIDSAMPNKVTKEAVDAGLLTFPDLPGTITEFRPEVTFGDSRVDFKGKTSNGQEFFVETKGATLESHGIVGFPDAPTIRAVKHVYNLEHAIDEGYMAYLFFVIQIDNIDVLTLNHHMAPKLTAAIKAAVPHGVKIAAYCSKVDENGMTLHRPAEFRIDEPFIDPQVEMGLIK
ncbi:DNA/RNA nuclease SfsA [Furfurilactobacillus sp.]|uniref:DNA/RNA nuclease SfsA n=1 Tax=Furfurilactobacillus sp. TaxID=2767911 RepID=UPI0025884EF8|nr:DNA/RNA nuclease SfsA [Furfurilactobacillus sp.]MCH4011639.1 DNA/RNA nuclease SfsA [Furfurilactobacillus sp.]